MLVPPDVQELHSAHLLLWRAWEQVHALESHIARWMHSGGYRFDKTTDDDGVLHATIRFNELPAEWSLLISESVHSMRASLDHLVFGLSALAAGRTLTEEEARKTEFPIFGREVMSDGALERKGGLLSPKVQAVLRQVQPHLALDYRTDRLWCLHELDNRTKHRSIQTTLVAYSAFMPAFVMQGSSGVVITAPNVPLRDGMKVFEGTPANPGGRTDIVAAMQVVFPWDDDLPIAGRPVVEILRAIHGRVRDIHSVLLGEGGYLVPMPASNAPLSAQEEDADLGK